MLQKIVKQLLPVLRSAHSRLSTWHNIHTVITNDFVEKFRNETLGSLTTGDILQIYITYFSTAVALVGHTMYVI